jgi:hypothetical protein
MEAGRAAPSTLRTLLRYAAAIVFVSIALLLSLALQVPFGNPFWFFFAIAVILTTWFGGRGLNPYSETVFVGTRRMVNPTIFCRGRN